MHTKENKNIILFTLGSSVSQLGSVIYTFAIGLYVLDLTGSGLQFATTLVIGFLPTILIHPFAGAIADRINKKFIVVSTDIMSGLLYLILFYYLQSSALSLIIIYSLTLMTNILNSFFSIAIDSAKPQLIGKNRLQRLNGISQIIMAGASIAGPIFGGLVYAYLPIELFICINGLSFLLSGISELFIDFHIASKPLPSNKPIGNTIFTDIKDACIYLVHEKEVMKYYYLFLILNIELSLGILVPLPYILNNYLAIKPEGVGVVNSLMPIGMICGALLVDYITKKVTWDKLLLPLAYFASILVLLIGLPTLVSRIIASELTIVIYYSSLMLVFGYILSLIDIPLMTFIQKSIKDEYLGRVLGILIPMIKIVNPIAYIISGILLNKINPFYIPISVGLLSLIVLVLSGKKMKSHSASTNLK